LFKLSKPRKEIWYSLLFLLMAMLVYLLYAWFTHDEYSGASIAHSTDPPNALLERLVTPATSTNRNDADLIKESTEVSAQISADNRDVAVCNDFINKSDHKKTASDTREQMYIYLQRADPLLKKALAQVVEAGDPRQKATALVLQAEMARGNARESYLQRHSNCEANEACQLELNHLQIAAGVSMVDAVAKMAVYSRDPILYATAFNACATLPQKINGFCVQVNAAQWASRDPENGTPWLYVLQELSQEGQGGNQSTIADALYKFSKAKRFDAQTNILSQLPKQFLPESNGIAHAHARLEDLASYIMSRNPIPSYRPIMNACKGSVLSDGNRREMCEDIARQLQRDNASFIEVILSGKMGEYLGWDKARTQSIQDDRDAIRGMFLDKANKALARGKSPDNVMKLCLDDLGSAHRSSRIDVEGEYRQYQDELRNYPVPRAELIRMEKN
jgi:hypothetical protein